MPTSCYTNFELPQSTKLALAQCQTHLTTTLPRIPSTLHPDQVHPKLSQQLKAQFNFADLDQFMTAALPLKVTFSKCLQPPLTQPKLNGNQ